MFPFFGDNSIGNINWLTKLRISLLNILCGVQTDKSLRCFVSPTVWSFITPNPDRSNNTSRKVGLIPVSSGWPSRLAARTSTSPSLFPHCPLLAFFPGWWQLSANRRPSLGGGSRLQPGPVTLLSAPRWDEARAPERWEEEGASAAAAWDLGKLLSQADPSRNGL